MRGGDWARDAALQQERERERERMCWLCFQGGNAGTGGKLKEVLDRKRQN